MSTNINQKAYLQKYLAGPSGDKKKKKKKAVKGTGLKIIDDDIDLSKLRTLDGDELDVFDQGEDAPQIAGIIDDRPEEVKKAEQFSSSSKWKIINQDDGFNSKLEVEEIKTDIKQSEKENELIFGKMYSDSEDEDGQKNDSDVSPPRKQDTENTAKSSKNYDSDSDFSPPRKSDARSPKRNDDRSPKSKNDRSRNHNDRSPNERHDNSAKRRDDRSPKKRTDDKRSYDRSPKRRDDRSPDQRQDKSTKKRSDDKRSYDRSPKRIDDRSPEQRHDKSTKRRNDDKRKNDDRSPKKKGDDRSPKRKSRERSPKRKNGDKSPRRKNYEKSPRRKNDDRSPTKVKSNRNDSKEPPRTEKPRERVRKPSRWGDFPPEDPATLQPSQSEHSPRTEDASPPRKSKKNYDSDQSPPRKSRKSHDSPPRKSKKNYDSDVSPPRKSKGDSKRRGESPEFLSPPKKQRYSPQRQSHKDRLERYQSNPRQDKSRKHRHSSDSDQSPPRKNRRDKSMSPPRKNKKPPENNKRRFNSDSDQSPPRRENRDTSERDRSKRGNDSPPPSNKKMAKTLEGKLAGLQDAKQLRHENESFRKREEEVFNKMTDEVSGRNAQVVSRKSKRETSEERQKLKEKAERQKELDEKYKKWSKGIKQLEDQEARVQDFIHESSKPLARLRDDRDLEDSLKQVERAGDPMLKYMRDRKRERGELGPEKPIYKGQFPPNRFNLRPGYRWDGVDRSNGYEKKFFDQQSKRKAQEEEAYKWSTEDL